ncbi:MAG: 50S ribosomal protein L13 [Clostridia bacterium]|nr:50S ribosomal protein L13 [Clostridia bacterium]
MNNTTYSAKAGEIERKWYVIDAEGKVVGRLASEVAKLLRGKHKPTYTPNTDTGDFVIVVNTDKMIFTGNKLEDKIYRRHTGYIGNMKETQAKDMMAKDSTKVLMLAVKGMLPKNSLGRKMLTKLRVYTGAEHEQIAQKPEVYNF